MKTICPYCDQEYPETPDEYLGGTCECQNCHQDFVVEKAVICLECGAANAKSATKCRRCGRLFRTRTVSPWQKVSLQRPAAAAVPPTRSAPRTSAASARQTGVGSSRKSSIWTKEWGSGSKASFMASMIAFCLFFAWKNGQFEKKNARTPKYPGAAQTRTSSSGTQRAAAQTRQSSSDSGKAAYEKGVRYFNEKNYVEGVKWYRKGAEQGNAACQALLGACYEHGVGVAKNPHEAVKWYRKSAEQGLAPGQHALGKCYMTGNGVAKNPTEAAKWYRKAAEQGLASGQSELGHCYLRGDGAAKDEAEAVKWLHKAAEQGYAEAQAALGVCYWAGKGVARNGTVAMEWLRLAAEQGHVPARVLLNQPER